MADSYLSGAEIALCLQHLEEQLLSHPAAVDVLIFVLDLNSALPLAVGGIVLEHVHHVIKVDERVVADLDVVVYSAT